MRRATMTQIPPGPARRRSNPMRAARAFLVVLTLLPGCSTVDSVTSSVLGTNAPKPGQAGYVSGFLGGVVADEPRAALAGREVLSQGGTAADAAIAVGLTLAVTLPSRAGLGGGGACIAYTPDPKSPNQGQPEAVLFTPLAPATPGSNADRPAAVPMLARGLFLLHARYGVAPFEATARSGRTTGALRRAGIARADQGYCIGGRPVDGRSECQGGVQPEWRAADRGPTAPPARPWRHAGTIAHRRCGRHVPGCIGSTDRARFAGYRRTNSPGGHARRTAETGGAR